MSESSIRGGTPQPRHARGKDVDALGPSDSSDSGSDVQGERAMSTAADSPDEWGAVVADAATDTDAEGTGERASADGAAPRDGADILPDRIIEDIGVDDDPSRRALSEEAEALAQDDDSQDEEEAEDADAPASKLAAQKER